MLKHLLRTTCLAAALLAPALLAQAATSLDAPIPVGPQVKVGKLANGLTWYIQRNARPERKLELRLVIKAGSILEDDDQQGLAHFLEHMAFNGSTHFKRHELVSYLQSIGVKFGADLNAYTSFDETVYILPIPTDRQENIDQGFQVLEDWAHGLTLRDEDIDKERAIVLEELRLGKGAQDRVSKQTLPKFFNGSRYASRLPIGKEEVLRNFTPDTLRRFYRDWYRPDLMAVVVVGDIDPARAEQLIKTHFGKLQNPAPARPRTYADIPAQRDTEALVVTDKELDRNALTIRYPVRPARPDSTLATYREKLVENLFEGILNQRLQDLAQQPEPPFMVGYSTRGKLTPRYRAFQSVALLGQRGAVPAAEALVQESERVRQFGFSAAELERTKKSIMRNIERSYNERDKTDSAVYVAEYMRNFLEQESIPGIEAEYKLVQQLLPGITLDELNAFARAAIPAKAGKLVIYTGVDKADQPAPRSDVLLAAVNGAEHAHLLARADKAVAAHLMDKPPAAGSIVATSEDKALGLTRLTLSNGVKVILKPTDFRNDQVLLGAVRFGGQTLFDDADIVNARYANAIVETMGLKDYTPVDLGKILAGKTAGVHLGLTNYTDLVSGAAGANDIETMLQLLWLKFADVRRDEPLFRSFMGKQAELARNQLAQPNAQFSQAIVGALYNNNPRAARFIAPEQLAKVDLDRSIAIYRQRFASAKDMTFVLVGSFDVEAIKPLLATYLGSLPTPDIPAAYRDVGLRPVSGVVKREVRSGSEDKSMVSLTFTGPANFSEAEEMRLSAVVEVMNLRLIEELREKQGLIYGGGANGNLTRIPYGHYSLGMTLPTGPQNVDKVVNTTFDLIARLQQDGPTAEEMDKIKRNWVQNHRKSLRENGYWMAHLQSALTEGTDPASILAVEQMVGAMSGADVQAAARRYLDARNVVQVVLYPEAAKAN